jgi:hypothetical protein
MSKSNTALDRKMVKKNHKLSFGYLVFYSVLLSLLTLGLSFLLGGIAGTVRYTIPGFLYDSIIGMLYVYNAVALVFQWLFALLFPGVYQFKGLSDNSWNMLYKMDVKPGRLAMNKLRVCIFSNLGIYLMGFILAFGIGFLKSSDKSMDIMTVLLLAACGIMALLTLITPTLAVGAATKGKTPLRLSILVAGGLVAFSIYSCGYFNCAAVSDITTSTGNLISLNPLGLLLIPALFAIVFPIITLSTASARAKNYNIEELDDELLVSLGVAENMLVLEEGRNRYNVAISGPDVNDADFDIQVPEMMPNKPPRPSRSGRDAPPREQIPLRAQQNDVRYNDNVPIQRHGQPNNNPGMMPPPQGYDPRQDNMMPPQGRDPRQDNMLMQQNDDMVDNKRKQKRGKKRRKDDYDEYDDY